MFEQDFPMRTAKKKKKIKNDIVITTILKYLSGTDCGIAIVKFGQAPQPMQCF